RFLSQEQFPLIVHPSADRHIVPPYPKCCLSCPVLPVFSFSASHAPSAAFLSVPVPVFAGAVAPSGNFPVPSAAERLFLMHFLPPDLEIGWHKTHLLLIQ